MSEQGPSLSDRLQLVTSRLAEVGSKVEFAGEQAVHEVNYMTLTSTQERVEGSHMAEMFTTEALQFLNDNLSERLSPLQATSEQIEVFRFLMDNVNNGSLILKKTDGRVEGGQPYVVNDYQAGKDISPGSVFGLSQPTCDDKNVHLLTRWSLRNSVHGFTVFGDLGKDKSAPKEIDFLTLPEKADQEKIAEIVGIGESKNNSVGVYNNGERIIFNHEGIHKGKRVARTDQYYLVGSFEGEGTQQNYWVYGCNKEVAKKMSVSSRVGMQEVARQVAGNK